MASSQLGDSWVADDINSSDADEEIEDYDAPQATRRKFTPKVTGQRPSPQTSPRMPTQKLIMPPVPGSIGDGSWAAPSMARSEKFRRRSKRTSMPASQSQTRTTSKLASPRPGFKHEDGDSRSSISSELMNILSHTCYWLLDVAGGALKSLKRPITWLLTIYLFAAIITLTQNFISNTFRAALSPVCRIPGVSLLELPICQPPQVDLGAPAEFDKLMNLQSKFEEMLEDSSNSLNLPFEMKEGETSVRDLRQTVTFSNIRSKNELLMEFGGFIDTARRASGDLQTFNSHVGGACDIILSTARWTQRILDDMALQQQGGIRGSKTANVISSLLTNYILSPFQPIQFTPSTLLSVYIEHTNKIGEQISRLLTEGQSLLQILKSLEDRLEAIASIVHRDNLRATADKDEILGQLWTMLGGNRAKLDKANKQLNLLRSVSEHRKLAWHHVSSAILKLQAMSAELESLRERLGSAQSLPDHPEIPLSVHLETIRLGVERLEAGRANAREIERAFLRRKLDGSRKTEIRFALDG